ncbi:probable glucan endo-1,3-beta-glucosidase A6 [Coffea eugenioides]|uniref:probable glucan endo-1,3-beta-glucosidase A6 n=1 Tax=Coffea eugenioides TaxID=49369 RepID=UPI000F6120A3|nr:probable glucan endo-1,3-beta-glucosidase A6 [Coffea eugenioides]
MKIAENFLIAPLFFCLLTFSNALTSSRIGVVYGTQGTNFPPINYTVQLLEIKNAGFVKLRDANHEILKSLSQKSVRVSISIANNFLVHIASNQTFANQWVQENVLAYYPDTMIRFILVGQEVLSQNDTTLWYNLVPAMRRILDSVRSHNIHNIKVGTPLAMDILESTFPPSSGKFRSDIPHDQVIIPLLQFLNQTKSYFFLNVFPYFTWSANPTNVSLDLALFRGDKNSSYRDPESGLIYTNLLDQMLDSVLFASKKLGLDHVALAISETGWPHAGDIDQPGANRYNAATYNRNLVHRMSAKPPIGTPARPGVFIPTFIYALFDEDQIPGRGTARHFGILQANSWPVYDLDLTGKLGEGDYPLLPLPSNNEPFKGNLWCVVASEANIMELVPQLESVCSLGNGICDALSPGNDCYEPVTIRAHASYAFSSYWVKFRSRGTACHFNGLAVLTTTDPSHGSCKFPSIQVGLEISLGTSAKADDYWLKRHRSSPNSSLTLHLPKKHNLVSNEMLIAHETCMEPEFFRYT